jgi:hypothetical protein
MREPLAMCGFRRFSTMMRLLRLALIVLILACSSVSDARAVPGSSDDWNVLKIGGGGQITNLDYPTSSSPFLITTDTAGAFGLNQNTKNWIQLLTSVSLPSAFSGNDHFLDGVYGLVSSAGDPTRCYLAYNNWAGGENAAHVLRSDNCNVSDLSKITFSDLAGFTSVCSRRCTWSGSMSAYKFVGPKIGVDPANKNVFYVNTPHNGQFVSTDGGASFCTIPNVTSSSLNVGGFNVPAVGIAFDPTSGTVNTPLCGSSAIRTATVWQCTQGDGCWRSTNGGNDFRKQISGKGPTNVSRAKVGVDGVFYATEYDQTKLWRFTDTWTNITPPGASSIVSVVVSPFTAENVVAVTASGGLFWSTNANSGIPAWTGAVASPTRTASDIPWFLVGGSNADYLNLSDIVMDPATPRKLWGAGGIGVWYTTSTGGRPSYTGLSNGIAQLVTNKLISPPGCNPVGAFWDRPVFYLEPFDFNKKEYGPNYTGVNNIEMGWSIDYATSNSNYIALLSNWGETDSAYSKDCGHTWMPYVNFPNLVNGNIGGGIAASTPDNVLFAASNNGDVYYSQDATSPSAKWAAIPAATFGHGMQASGPGVVTGWGNAYYSNRQAVCADRVSANTFYVSNYQDARLGGGIYRISFPSGVLAVTQIIGGPTDTGGLVTQLHCVPGHAGHLFYAQGQLGSLLQYSTNGTSDRAHFRQIRGPTDVYQVATGAIKPGNDYPSVYINAKIGRAYSIWRSDNTAAEWAAGTVTWTDIGLPLDSIDNISTMAGDNNTYGVLLVGGRGTTTFYYKPPQH